MDTTKPYRDETIKALYHIRRTARKHMCILPISAVRIQLHMPCITTLASTSSFCVQYTLAAYHQYRRVAQETRQTLSNAVYGRVQGQFRPIRGVHDNRCVVRGCPSHHLFPLCMAVFGVYITFVCWDFCVVSFAGLCCFHGAEAGIRMRNHRGIDWRLI